MSSVDFLPYSTVHPRVSGMAEQIRAVAQVAARDNSCPACRDAARAPPPEAAALVRAGRTQDDRARQPRCGRAPRAVSQLSAPLFMGAEWPRWLLARKAPFGLRMGGKTEAQMQDTLRRYLMNVSQPLRCRYRTCAVVGSAGRLRDGRLGAAIDAHDAVIRINAAPTSGFETAVGRRTTWRVHNSEKPWFMASLNTPELHLVVCHTAWIGACQHQAFSGLWSTNVSIINPVFYSQLWGVLRRPLGKQVPSTGLLAIALALGVCDRVRIFGFSQRGDSTVCAHHYWDCPRWSRDYNYLDPKHPFHDWSGEAELRERWLRAGVVEDGAAWAASPPESEVFDREVSRTVREAQAAPNSMFDMSTP